MKYIYLLITTALIISCKTSRNIQSTVTTTDSTRTHLVDSFTRVLADETARHQQEIHEITSSGVTFDNTPCPDLDSLKILLDSAGVANMELWEKDQQIASLKNQVKINRDGSIEASGKIKSAFLTADRMANEANYWHRSSDSLKAANDSLNEQLSKKEVVKEKIVERTFIPWWMFGLLVVALFLGLYLRGFFIVKPKI